MDRQILASVGMDPGLRREDGGADGRATLDTADFISPSEQIKNILASL
jgi:hypothetical protein